MLKNAKPVRLKFKKGSDISTLVFTADWHLGCPTCDLDALDCLHDRIMSGELQWIHGADIIDGVMPGDKRYDIDFVKSTLLDQMNTAVERVKAMNKYCVGMVEGNHENAPSKIVGNVSQQICKDAGIDFLTQVAFLRFMAPHGQSVGFISHYTPSISNNNEDPLVREAQKTSRLRKVLRNFQADLKLGAHIHQFLCRVPVSEDRLMLGECDEVKKRPVSVHEGWEVVSPAMFRTYSVESNYAQARLCKPTDIGWAEIDLSRDGKVVEVRNVLGDGSVKRRYVPVLVD